MPQPQTIVHVTCAMEVCQMHSTLQKNSGLRAITVCTVVHNSGVHQLYLNCTQV
jgi:hypothetical protein